MRQQTIHTILRSAMGIALPVALLLSGCVKRELEMRPVPPTSTKGYAEITLDWSTVPTPPQSVRYLLYNERGELVQEATGLSDGFRDSLSVGTYRLVVHNEDARQVDYRGIDSYDTAEVFAQETESPHPHTSQALRHVPGVPCILEPHFVYGTGCCNEFTAIEIMAGQTTRATVTPEQLTRQVEFHFVVKSPTPPRSLTGVLSGVAPGLFIVSRRHNTESCAVEFNALLNTPTTSTEYIARLNVFNLLTTAESPDRTNTLDVTLALDNREFYTEVDLTPVLKQIIADNGGVIPIEIPIEVTFNIVGVELTVTVAPWDESGSGGGDFE